MSVNNNYVTNFSGKVNLFNELFSTKFSTIINDSSILNNQNFNMPKGLLYFDICASDTVKHFWFLYLNEFHGYNGESISMLKRCTFAVLHHLNLRFDLILGKECFPQKWKKSETSKIVDQCLFYQWVGNLSQLSWRTLNLLSANPTKWLNTLEQFVGNLPTNCLSVFGYFVGLALKGLNGNNLLKCYQSGSFKVW